MAAGGWGEVEGRNFAHSFHVTHTRKNADVKKSEVQLQKKKSLSLFDNCILPVPNSEIVSEMP